MAPCAPIDPGSDPVLSNPPISVKRIVVIDPESGIPRSTAIVNQPEDAADGRSLVIPCFAHPTTSELMVALNTLVYSQ